MKFRDLTKSGAFATIVLTMVMALLPFAVEQIGEATDLYRFPVKATILGWFTLAGKRPASPLPIDAVKWEQYREDLAKFSVWADERRPVEVRVPKYEPKIIEVVEEKPVREIWRMPIVGCTPGYLVGRERGYVFVAGFNHPLKEGDIVAPAGTQCGYEILKVGERSIWLRAVLDDDAMPVGGEWTLPEFTRVDGESLVLRKRRFGRLDAFPLESGGWLVIDSFLPPDTVVFGLLDENRQREGLIVCVVLGEKGGR